MSFLASARAAISNMFGGWNGRSSFVVNSSTRSAAGYAITPETALTNSAFWRAVEIISTTGASVPLRLLQRNADGSTVDVHRQNERLTDRWLLLNNQADEELGSIAFRSSMIANVALYGDGLAYVRRRGDNHPLSIQLLDNRSTAISRSETTGRLQYEVYGQDRRTPIDVLTSNDVIHVRSPLGTTDGTYGRSLVAHAADAIGSGIAIQRHIGATFANNCRPGGILSVPGKLDRETSDAIRADFTAMHGSADKSGRVAVLPGDMTFKPITSSMHDLQIEVLCRANIAEIARWTGVPRTMLAAEEESSYSTAQELSTAFVRYTLSGYLRLFEEALNRSLLGPRESRNGLHWSHDWSAHLLSDPVTRAEVLKSEVAGSLRSPNEARSMIGLGPVEGGENVLAQGAMAPLHILAEGRQFGGTSSEESEKTTDKLAESEAVAERDYRILRLIGDVDRLERAAERHEDHETALKAELRKVEDEARQTRTDLDEAMVEAAKVRDLQTKLDEARDEAERLAVEARDAQADAERVKSKWSGRES